MLTNTSGTTWTVWGSSTGSMGSFSGSQATQNIPTSGNAQCVINFTQNANHAVGDVVTFGLIAASLDANVQKKLQFSAITGSGYNNDRSRSTWLPGLASMPWAFPQLLPL